MDARAELREFLMSRRAKITPDQVGIVPYGMRARRVSGLRRDELAQLAGMSVDYYARFERGQITSLSDSGVDAIARALRLDESEREHLDNLIRALQPVRPRRSTPRRAAAIRPSMGRILDALDGQVAAFVCNASMDVVAWNTLAAGMFDHWRVVGDRVPNQARFLFLEPFARELFADWEASADGIVAILRSLVARDPQDAQLAAVIGELSMRSDVFRELWAHHDVGNRYSGKKRFIHPMVGALELDVEVIPLPADPGLTLIAHSAPKGSPTDDALQLLMSSTLERLAARQDGH